MLRFRSAAYTLQATVPPFLGQALTVSARLLAPRESNRSGPIRVMAIDPPEISTRPSLPTEAVGLMPPALARRTCPRAAHNEYQTLLTQPFGSNQSQKQNIHYPLHCPRRRCPDASYAAVDIQASPAARPRVKRSLDMHALHTSSPSKVLTRLARARPHDQIWLSSSSST